MIRLRLARADEGGVLSMIGSATFLETYSDQISGSDIVAHCASRHSEAVYAAWLRDPACRVWLAVTPTDAPAGYLVLTPATVPESAPDGRDMEVARIYVLNRYHRTGTGDGLMQAAIEAARVRRARRLVLGVKKDNARALAFYDRHGFSVIGERVFQVGVAMFDDFILGKAL